MVLGIQKKKTKSTIGRKRMYNVGKLLRVRQFIKKKKKKIARDFKPAAV